MGREVIVIARNSKRCEEDGEKRAGIGKDAGSRRKVGVDVVATFKHLI